MPDTSDSTRCFDLQCLATDFYLTVYTELSGHPTAPLTPGTPGTPLCSNNGLLENQHFFDAQTKHKDKYYTPKLPGRQYHRNSICSLRIQFLFPPRRLSSVSR